MNGQEFLGKLLEYYQSSFDIVRPFETECGSFDAYAAFNVTSAKYVLIKKAQLWQAKCYEHAFFSCVTKMDGDALHKFRQQIICILILPEFFFVRREFLRRSVRRSENSASLKITGLESGDMRKHGCWSLT